MSTLVRLSQMRQAAAELTPMGGVPATRAICASGHLGMDDSGSLTWGGTCRRPKIGVGPQVE